VQTLKECKLEDGGTIALIYKKSADVSCAACARTACLHTSCVCSCDSGRCGCMPARERAYEIMTMHVHARCSRQSGKRWIFQNLTIRPLKLKAITNKVELGYVKRARAGGPSQECQRSRGVSGGFWMEAVCAHSRSERVVNSRGGGNGPACRLRRHTQGHAHWQVIMHSATAAPGPVTVSKLHMHID